MAEEEDVPDSWEEVEDTHIIDKKIEKMRQKTNSELSSSSLRPDADIFLPGKICQMPYGNGFRPPFRPPYGQTPPVRILKRDDDSSLVPVRSEDSSKPKTKIKSLKEREAEYREARLRIFGEAQHPDDDLSSRSPSDPCAPSSQSSDSPRYQVLKRSQVKPSSSSHHLSSSSSVIRQPRAPDGTCGFAYNQSKSPSTDR